MARCEAECPETLRHPHVAMSFHVCSYSGRHQSHHCGGCGALWDENVRTSLFRNFFRTVPRYVSVTRRGLNCSVMTLVLAWARR